MLAPLLAHCALLMAPTHPDPQPAPVRLAVLGLTHTHVHWLLGRPRDRGDVELVGVYEPNQDLARRYIDQHDLPRELHYTDVEAMLETTAPEAVCLFGTTAEHLEHTLLAAAQGLHVMVEKPLALDLDEARRMSEATRKAGVELLTNYETTWYPSNGAVAGVLVDENGIGTLRRAVFETGHPGPVEIGCNPEFLAWLLDPDQNGGGALVDFGCYGANLMTRWMDGRRPLRVSAITRQVKPGTYPRVDDDATITVDYGDAVCVIQASWCWPRNVKDMALFGTDGDLRTRGSEGLELRRGDGPVKEVDCPPLASESADPFAHFAAVVRGRVRANALSSLENNLIVMEILDAARESARSGRTVELPR